MFQLHTAQKLCRLFELELQRNFVWMEDVFFTGRIHVTQCARRKLNKKS